MRVVAIIQQRLGSTRLPGKSLLPLAGKPLTARLMERVRRAKSLDMIVVAAPKEPDALQLQEVVLNFAKDHHLVYGQECAYYLFGHLAVADLVGRYHCSAQASQADLIVRIPGDNPLVEPEAIDDAVMRYLKTPTVFCSNTILRVQDQYVDGLGVEVFSATRIKMLDELLAPDDPRREHVHQYFHEHGLGPFVPENREVLRLDVNNRKDYEFVASIYEALYPDNPTFGITEILRYLKQKEVPV